MLLKIGKFSFVPLYSLRARKNLRLNVGDVDAAAVACGFGRAIGNKVYFPCYIVFISISICSFCWRKIGFS